jgi:hypothetical protein
MASGFDDLFDQSPFTTGHIYAEQDLKAGHTHFSIIEFQVACHAQKLIGGNLGHSAYRLRIGNALPLT